MPIGNIASSIVGIFKKSKAKAPGSELPEGAPQIPNVVDQGNAQQAAQGAAAKTRRRASSSLFGNVATMLGSPRLGNTGARTTYGGGKSLLGE